MKNKLVAGSAGSLIWSTSGSEGLPMLNVESCPWNLKGKRERLVLNDIVLVCRERKRNTEAFLLSLFFKLDHDLPHQATKFPSGENATPWTHPPFPLLYSAHKVPNVSFSPQTGDETLIIVKEEKNFFLDWYHNWQWSLLVVIGFLSLRLKME